MRRLSLGVKALRELGFVQVGLYTLYQAAKWIGYWRWWRQKRYRGDWLAQVEWINIPGADKFLSQWEIQAILAEADDLTTGRVRLFGGEQAPLVLSLPEENPQHWSNYDKGTYAGRDIKFTWEPARFGWVFLLAQAYVFSQNPRYAEAFWGYFRSFMAANPPEKGPNWASAQEVGLRLIGLVFGLRVFGEQAELSDHAAISTAIADHAQRIPPTVLYARAQNNNHLLVEAAALYTAGLVIPDHPQSSKWRSQGWRWLHYAIQTQIEVDGTYVQQSTNYHRLALQVALWVYWLARLKEQVFPEESLDKLKAATVWLLNLVDPVRGDVPNLGPNDGAYVFSLTGCAHRDFRPVLQAAACAFLGVRAFEMGQWDDMAVWFGYDPRRLPIYQKDTREGKVTGVICNQEKDTWAYLRAARFRGRPGHADQLHVDLWWQGDNLALDPGTYLYNGSQPWENSLMTAFVHNTITIDGKDQMTQAGRFLYLDRAQAGYLEGDNSHLVAEHDGYRQLGLTHRREVRATPQGWQITDWVLPKVTGTGETQRAIRLYWCLPDWEYQQEGTSLQIVSGDGKRAILSVGLEPMPVGYQALRTALYRAGERVIGDGEVNPIMGWFSPTYGHKVPALSFVVNVLTAIPVSFVSTWRLES